MVFSGLGTACVLSKIPLLAPVGTFFVMFANGSIYATSTRYIDSHVDKAFNVSALSVWLFVGDIGSVTGSFIAPFMDDWVCTSHSLYTCCSTKLFAHMCQN